jgi:hypothetical protein
LLLSEVTVAESTVVNRIVEALTEIDKDGLADAGDGKSTLSDAEKIRPLCAV